MSTLTVIRHGQARPFEQDSDRLSPPGEQQARALGQYWKRLGVTFDEVLSGSLQRHRRTAELAIKQATDISDDWNEYDAGGIVRHFAPQYDPAEVGPDRNRRFQAIFEPAVLAWISSPNGAAGLEPWTVFRERVLRGLRRLQDGPRNRRVALFTSGGPIGVLVQTAVGAPDRSFADINWRVRNCSITEFVFSHDRFALDSFNGIPHLEDASLRTFR